MLIRKLPKRTNQINIEFRCYLKTIGIMRGNYNNMNIDITTMKIAMHLFENRHGSLYELLNDLTKRERRNLLRYGKLSKRVINENKKDKVDEFLNVSFEFRQVLNGIMKPRCIGKKQKTKRTDLF